MSVIPDFVIEGWEEQYDEGSPLWKKYPEIEREDIIDLSVLDGHLLRDMHFNHARPNPSGIVDEQPHYLATAGAPLSGKTTILQKYLDDHLVLQPATIDPDYWGIRNMVNTYTNYLLSSTMIAGAENYRAAQIRAYDVARPASNYLTLEMFNDAVKKGVDIAHGTTMTSPFIGGLLKGLKEQDYYVELLLCGANNDTRAQSQETRSNEQGFYQATPEDIHSKGEDFPQRMATYFEHADSITIHWRHAAQSEAVVAADFEDGDIIIYDEQAFKHFQNKYSADKGALAKKGIEIPAFSQIQQQYISRYDV